MRALKKNEVMAVAFAVFTAALFASPELALAQSTSSSGCFQPINTAMTAIMSFMTGTFATTAATCAIAATGYMCFTQRIPWGWLFAVVVGIALIFGAATIVTSLSSGMNSGSTSSTSGC